MFLNSATLSSSSFASSDVVKRHLQENGLLKLSITLKVIGDNSGSPESKSSSTHRASFDNYPGERSICPRLVATKESPTKYHGLSTETVAPPVKFSTSCSLKVEVAGPLIMAKDDTNSPTKAKGESPKQWKDTNKKLADKKPMVDTGSVLIEADSPSKTKKSPPSPPSFKPLITFNGLYTAGTGSPDLKNDGSLSRSPTGLIAKPYITYSDATTPSIFDETDFCFPVCCNQSKYNISRRSSTSGFESPGDLIGAIDSRKNSPELVIESGSPQLEKSPTQAAAGNDQKQSTTSESLENTVNADDRTLSINRRANLRGDNDDRFHESTSSENSSNVTPRPYESFQIHAQTLLSAPKSFCTIALGCGDHVATAKASVPAKVQGKQYNLLADSLRVIAQHLDVVTVPDDAKNINLMLPFQKNNTDCDVRTISSVEGTIGDNETHDRSITRGDSDHHLPNFHIDSYSSPHSEMNSMRDLHSEMSPISPPSYSVSKYSHYSPSIDRTEDQRLTLSTIYEQNHASDNIISLNNQNTSDEDENESKRRRKDVPTESRSAKSSPDGSEFTFIGAYKQGHSPVNYVAKIKEEISAMINKSKALKRPIKLTKKIKTKIKMPTKIVVATKDIYRNSSIISMLIAFIGLALNHIVAQHVIVTVSAAAYYTALTAMKLIVLAIVMIFVVLINMSTVVKEEKSATHCSTP